jgi:hypothetical protein
VQAVDKDHILHQLESKQGCGEHVDDRLFAAVRGSQALYLLRMDDEESLLSLVWQERDDTRLLTPREQPRTLKDVCHRLQGRGFGQLASPLGLPTDQHNPAWFRKCAEIDAAFDYSRFGWISVVPPTDNERTQSPRGSFYIYDGVHRSLVLASRLLGREIDFQPIAALLILPRPGVPGSVGGPT